MPESGTEGSGDASGSKAVVWTEELDAALFRGICRFKPAGTHKHTNMLGLASHVAEDTARFIPITALWQRLAHYYDLARADRIEVESEQLPAPLQGLITEMRRAVLERHPEMLAPPATRSMRAASRSTTRSRRAAVATASSEHGPSNEDGAVDGAGADGAGAYGAGTADADAASGAGAGASAGTGTGTAGAASADGGAGVSVTAPAPDDTLTISGYALDPGFDLPWDEFGEIILEHARAPEPSDEASVAGAEDSDRSPRHHPKSRARVQDDEDEDEDEFYDAQENPGDFLDEARNDSTAHTVSDSEFSEAGKPDFSETESAASGEDSAETSNSNSGGRTTGRAAKAPRRSARAAAVTASLPRPESPAEGSAVTHRRQSGRVRAAAAAAAADSPGPETPGRGRKRAGTVVKRETKKETTPPPTKRRRKRGTGSVK